MNLKVVCPSCYYHNDSKNEICTNCGQQLKIKNIKRKKEKSLKTFSRRILKSILGIVVVWGIVLIVAASNDLKNVIKIPKLFTNEIVKIDNKTIYINENDKFELPTNICAKMKRGKNELVNVQWETTTVDSAVVGSTNIKGVIKEYDKTVAYTINVLPHKIINNLKNLNYCIVENSLIELNLNDRPYDKKALVEIEKGGESRQVQFPIENGRINCKVYLPFGSGNYKISVGTNKGDKDENFPYLCKDFNVTNKDKRDRLLAPDIYIESDSKEIIILANKITEQCSSDMEKTKAIHDWVASNIAYDTEAYYSGNLHNYGAIETMNGKKAVCSGYANLTAALNRAVGIKTKFISGTAKNNMNNNSEGHAWNETFVDNKWIIQDVTWDAGGIDETTHKFTFQLSDKYFNPSPDKFILDHTKTGEQ